MLADRIARMQNKPLPWTGPQSDNARTGGITFSLLSRYLADKERFRILVVDGLKPREGFNRRLDYGNMWHVCEEALAKQPRQDSREFSDGQYVTWSSALQTYCRQLCKKYPTQQEQVDHWYNVCKVQFPLYVDFWSKHPDVTDRAPLLSEQVFHVHYQLPSGRVVYLRGKWDSVDLVGEGKQAAIWLQENKSKGDINEEQLRRQLTFDLQTMLYVVALETLRKATKGGVLYEGV